MSNTDDQVLATPVCFVNIGPKERQKRLTFGIVSFVVGVAIAVVLIATHATPWLSLLAFPFFYLAGTGFFQWRDKT